MIVRFIVLIKVIHQEVTSKTMYEFIPCHWAGYFIYLEWTIHRRTYWPVFEHCFFCNPFIYVLIYLFQSENLSKMLVADYEKGRYTLLYYKKHLHIALWRCHRKVGAENGCRNCKRNMLLDNCNDCPHYVI